MNRKHVLRAVFLCLSVLSCIRDPSGPGGSGGVWHTVRGPDGETYEDMAFPDARSGWIVGNRGRILFTPDGGETWEA